MTHVSATLQSLAAQKGFLPITVKPPCPETGGLEAWVYSTHTDHDGSGFAPADYQEIRITATNGETARRAMEMALCAHPDRPRIGAVDEAREELRLQCL